MAKQRSKTQKSSTRDQAKQIAAFGAAVSALVVANAPSAQAAIIDLTPIVGSANLNFLGPASAGGWLALGGAGSLYQFNDTIGKTLGNFDNLDWARAEVSQTVDPAGNFLDNIGLGTGLDGTYTFAFRNALNQVGWIRMDLGGAGGAIHYIDGAYNNDPGGSIHVGSTPEPATTTLAALSLLAMGARGVRRMRANRKQDATTTL